MFEYEFMLWIILCHINACIQMERENRRISVRILVGTLRNMGKTLSTKEGAHHIGRIYGDASDEKDRRVIHFTSMRTSDFAEYRVCENSRNARTEIRLEFHIPVNPITAKFLTVMFTHVDS